MPFKKEGLAWHEKSVEYRFVIDGRDAGIFDIAWPLDGNEEKAGDAIFRAGFLYYIVEFKGDFEAFDKEYKKFAAGGKNAIEGEAKYLLAKEKLAEQGRGCHFMICGDVEGEGQDAKFLLRRYAYFDCDVASTKANPLPGPIEGISCDAMHSYIAAYAPFKKGELASFEEDSDEGDSGRGQGTAARSLLVGVHAESGKHRAWDLKDCIRLELRLQAKNAPSVPTPSGSGRRGP